MSDHSDSRPTVALCMIVKNEAARLGRCLEAARPFVDEIVVVDTGSTDDTVAIAESHGARVVSYVWQDDFAHARNVSLEAATADWAFVLDADEIFQAPKDHLRRLAAGLPDPLATGEVTVVGLTRLNYYKADERPEDAQRVEQRRFFPRAWVRWRDRVHETPSVLLAPPVPRERWEFVHRQDAESVIHHGGFVSEVMLARNKRERNRRLLELRVQERPDDMVGWYYLAEERLAIDDLAGTVECGERCWANPKLRATFVDVARFYALALIRLGRLETAMRVLDEAIAVAPDRPQFHRMKAQLSEGIAAQAPRSPEAPTGWLGRAVAARAAGRLDEARALLAKAEEAAPHHAEVHFLKAVLSHEGRDHAAALAQVTRCLELEPDRPEAAMLAGRVLHAQGDSALGAAFLRRAVALRPGYEVAIKLLAQVEANPRAEQRHPALEAWLAAH